MWLPFALPMVHQSDLKSIMPSIALNGKFFKIVFLSFIDFWNRLSPEHTDVAGADVELTPGSKAYLTVTTRDSFGNSLDIGGAWIEARVTINAVERWTDVVDNNDGMFYNALQADRFCVADFFRELQERTLCGSECQPTLQPTPVCNCCCPAHRCWHQLPCRSPTPPSTRTQ